MIEPSAATIHLAQIGTPPRRQAEWASFTVRLDPRGGWRRLDTSTVATETKIRSVLASLTALRIRGPYDDWLDASWMDNVVLSNP